MTKMRKVILVGLLVLIKMTASAQKARVFNTFALDGNFSKSHFAPDIRLGQSLLIESTLSFRFNTAINFSGDFIQSGEIPNINSQKAGFIQLKKTHFNPTFSLPVGVEAGYRKIALGVSFELLSVSIGKNLDSLNYTLEDAGEANLNGLNVIPNRFNFIGSKSYNKALDASLYLVYTYNDSFSFRLGFTRQEVLYRTTVKSNSQTQKFDKFGFNEIKPFLGIRFNIEK